MIIRLVTWQLYYSKQDGAHQERVLDTRKQTATVKRRVPPGRGTNGNGDLL